LISFRFHLVSIVAVFLALAIGIVVGSTVIDQGIVDTLRDRVEAVNNNLSAREEANDRLREVNEELSSFVLDSSAYAVDQRLPGAVAVIVTDRGVDDEPVDRTIELLDQAGAAVRGVLPVQPAWDLADEERRANLADAIEMDADEPVESLQERTAALVVTDLASSVEVVDDDTGALDAITELRLVDFEVMDEVVVPRAARIVFVVVSGPGSNITPVNHTEDFVRAATEVAGSVVQAEVYVASEDGPDRADSLAAVFGDPDLAAQVATVDDLDLDMGPTTVVLALAAAQAGQIGHYGVGDTADRAAPLPPGSS
jgi:hypothetical protein